MIPDLSWDEVFGPELPFEEEQRPGAVFVPPTPGLTTGKGRLPMANGDGSRILQRMIARATRAMVVAILVSFMVAGVVLVAEAGSITMGAEYTFGAGSNDFNWGCLGSFDFSSLMGGYPHHGIQCVNVPGIIVGATGTSNLKYPNMEVLATVTCEYGGGGGNLWQGNHNTLDEPQAIPIEVAGDISAAGLSGRCWMIPGGTSLGAVAPAGYEFQLTIFYR